MILLASPLVAQESAGRSGPLVLERQGRVISLVPYAPNVLRITMSIDKAAATAHRDTGSWHSRRQRDGPTIGMRTVATSIGRRKWWWRVASGELPADKLPQPMPLDDLNRQLRQQYFGGGSRLGPHNDALLVTAADGRMLLHMRTWMMAPENPEVAQADPADKGYRVAAMFDSPADEHYYGLGQQQKGLDGPARSRNSLLARLFGNRRPGCVRSVYGLQWRLRLAVGQPIENDRRSWIQWPEYVVVRGWRPGVVFRHCRADQR